MEPFNFRHLDVETNTSKYKFPTTLPKRPVDNQPKLGREIQVRVNQFKVTQWPQKTVYQYDVSGHNYISPHNFRSRFHSRFTLAAVLRNAASFPRFGNPSPYKDCCNALIVCGCSMVTRLHGKMALSEFE